MNNQNLKLILEERRRVECSTNLFEEATYEAYSFVLLFLTPFMIAAAFAGKMPWFVPVAFGCGAVIFGLLRMITSTMFEKTKQKKLQNLDMKISELNET